MKVENMHQKNGDTKQTSHRWREFTETIMCSLVFVR